ncbi:endoplasmic reticulum vesicle transporter [Helicosporidium sp. ATCC 50920]|nr:endoplasmic reticulum vesicle transporter [Helicosporidium sp. ATCC 50920]|eukprot:KDD76673.1 endoplasmic reticulum vesicle transporter [Helicosporidium sp. ATCC 50920]
MYGQYAPGLTPSRPRGGSWSLLRHFDAFPKQREDAAEFFHSTVAGGVITLVAAALMALLFFSELRLFLRVDTATELLVDSSRGEQMSIHFDVTFHRMPCSWVSLDVMDISGELHLDLEDHELFKRRLSSEGDPLDEGIPHALNATHVDAPKMVNGTACGSCYGAETQQGQCCNTCEEVRTAYRKRGWAVRDTAGVAQCKDDHYLEELNAQKGEGCHMWGRMLVNKVAGNFHIAPGKSYQQGGLHIHDLSPFKSGVFDFSHTIHVLAFGQEYPGMENPLDGSIFRHDADEGGMPSSGQYQYFLKVVPTTYIPFGGGGNSISTNQFSVTEHFQRTGALRGAPDLPGVFFFYDLSPIHVRFLERRSSFFAFLTSVCAIVGGIFTVSGIVDATLYHGQKTLRKKLQMGKQY